MPNPIELIDHAAMEVARTAEVLVYAMEGLCEKQIRENPTAHGLNVFMQTSREMSEATLDQVVNKVMNGVEDALEASLSDSERTFYDARVDSVQYALIVREVVWGAFQQVRSHFARRARAATIAKTTNLGPNITPKIQARDGSNRGFKEYLYLTARSLMVNFYNEVKIGYMAENGYTEFTLDTENPELIDSVYQVEDYPELAPTLFHPRTSKLVGAYYVST